MTAEADRSAEKVAVAEVLSGHQPSIQGSGGFFVCSCHGWGYDDVRHEGTYAEHLTTVLIGAEKWREAGWALADDVLDALTALRVGVRELRESFAPMVDQGSGSYLNPRIVVARLDALLSSPPGEATTP